MDDDRQRENDRALYRLISDPDAPAAHLEMVNGALVAHAWPILHGWIRSGQIFQECDRHHRALHALDEERRLLHERPADAEDLVQEVLIAALRRFREWAVTGRYTWNPDGTAALTTFFIGCCVLVFPGPFRIWRTRVRDEIAHDDIEVARAVADTTVCVEDEVVIRRIVEERLDAMPPLIRTIVEMTAEGHGQAEIARATGLSGPRAVEGRLRRHRDRELDRLQEEDR